MKTLFSMLTSDPSQNALQDDEITKNKTKTPTAILGTHITLLHFMASYPQDPAESP